MSTYTLDELNALDDASFNRVVAEGIGWRMEYRSTTFHDVEVFREWVFVRPDGTKSKPGVSETMVERELLKCLPDHTHDLNAAWELVADMARSYTPALSVRLSLLEGSVLVNVMDGDTGEALPIAAEHASLVRALATAWVLWKQDTKTE